MRTLSNAVGAALQRFFRKVRLKAQVGSMSFVDEDKETFLVSIGRHGLQIAGDSIVSRISKDDGLGARVSLDSLL